MSLVAPAAALPALLAVLPLLVSKRRSLLNPAFYVFLIVLWSVSLKSLYIVFFRPYPLTTIHDMIYVASSSVGFLLPGVMVATLAMAAYSGGYLLGGKNSWIPRPLLSGRAHLPKRSYGVIAVLGVLSLVAFVVYLRIAGIDFFSLPFSAKRFRPQDTGVISRFQYFPYYFFKIALSVGSTTYVAALLLVQASSRLAEKRRRALVVTLFLFTLLLAHFASLRLFILLLLFQIFLLVYFYHGRRQLLFVGSLGLMTAISFVMITFVNRAPAPLPIEPAPVPRIAQIDQAENKTDTSVPEGSAGAPAVASNPRLHGGSAGVAGGEPSGAPSEGAAGTAVGSGDGSPERPASPSPPERMKPVAPAPLQGRGAGVAGGSTNTIASGPSVATSSSTHGRTGAVGTREESQKKVRRTLAQRVRNLGEAAFGGRYFMDVSKLAHIVEFFPSKRAFMWGETWVPVTPPRMRTADPGDTEPLGISRYLAKEVFGERRNNVPPGFAGEMYINFGWSGVLAGFLLLGWTHRIMFDQLTVARECVITSGILIVLIVNTTFVLLNSGLISTLGRTFVDLAILLLVFVPSALLQRRIPVVHAEQPE
ncbi:MAG: hypothetical protein WBX15_14505 [Thermoanaerobaculia bacterium]